MVGLVKNNFDQTVDNLRTSFWVLSVPRTIVLEQLIFAGKYGLETTCICWKIWARNNLYLLENMNWK